MRVLHFHQPRYEYDKYGRASVKFEEFQKLLSGEYDSISIYSEFRRRTFNFTLQEILPFINDQSIIEDKIVEWNGVHIVVLKFVKLFRKLEELAVEAAKIEKTYTQIELANSWEVRQCRLAELKRAGLLVPDSKIGKTYYYSEKIVNEALQNVYVQQWIKNTSEVDKVNHHEAN